MRAQTQDRTPEVPVERLPRPGSKRRWLEVLKGQIAGINVGTDQAVDLGHPASILERIAEILPKPWRWQFTLGASDLGQSHSQRF